MPIPLAIIPAIIGAAATIGTTVYGGIKQGDAADAARKQQEQQQAQLAADQKAQAEKDAQTQQAQKNQLLTRAAPDAQAQTGGALTDQPLAALIAQIAGLPGSAPSSFTPGSSGSGSGSTSSLTQPGGGFGTGSGFGSGSPPFDLAELARSLQGGEVTGGSTYTGSGAYA